MDAEHTSPGGTGPALVVRAQASGWSLPAGPAYLIGRDPAGAVVLADDRVSWQHAVLRFEEDRWVLADNGSTNGTYAAGRRVDRIEINGACVVRLGDAADGPVLSCTVMNDGTGTVPPPSRTLRIGRAADNDLVIADPSVSGHHAELRMAGGVTRIVDLDSTNGTFVNERRVTTAALAEGDVAGFGTSTFRLTGGELREFTGAGSTAVDPGRPVPAAPPPVP
ncbi:MAG: FHA domain-containing protein, partial [Streptosporangiaceae bacterium]